MPGFLNKTLFKLYRRCPRLLALSLKHPELRSRDGERLARHLTEQGQRVGCLAQKQFKTKGAVEITTHPIKTALVRTRAAIERGGVVIEASFLDGNAFARTDILNLPAKELIEIKSCTKQKDEHALDTGFQLHVLRQLGVAVNEVTLGLINRDFLLKSEKTPLDDLISYVVITKDAEAVLPEIPADLKSIEKILGSSRLPRREICQRCFSPMTCPFIEHCHTGLEKHTVLDLRRDYRKKFELHKSGVQRLADIPGYVTLTDFQKQQVQAELRGEAVINRKALHEHLKKLQYPIYFLDFEAFTEAVPRYAGTRPYQQIPFQASVHVLRAPGEALEHYEYLHGEDTNPAPALSRFLAATIGNSGSVVAYHASYERGRLEELAERCPRHRLALRSIVGRLWDLEDPFAKGWYVDPAFRGSTSIKEVLPTIVPELSYKHLTIQNGSEASLQYLEMIASNTANTRKQAIRQSLLDYCGLDTIAMQKILSVLEQVSK